MTDRILSEEDLVNLEEQTKSWLGNDGWIRCPVTAFDLICTSHRLLQEIVKQYERKDYDD